MTTTVREIRPFKVSGLLEQFVHAIKLSVNETTLEDGGRVVLSEDEYLTCQVGIELSNSTADLSAVLDGIAEELVEFGLQFSDITLAVNLYSGFLKISEFPICIRLDELNRDHSRLTIPTADKRPSALRAAKSGCQVEIALVLARQLPKLPLRPWRKGTWLARAEFSIATEGVFNGFSPRPLDKDRKAEFGLPPSTARYIVIPDGVDPTSDEGSPDLVELWVDADLLATISANDKSDGSVAMQRQLFVDAFGAVVLSARSQADFDSKPWKDVSKSMLGKMVLALAGKKSGESEDAVQNRCESLFNLMKKDSAVFMAHVEAFADCTSAFLKMIGA